MSRATGVVGGGAAVLGRCCVASVGGCRACGLALLAVGEGRVSPIVREAVGGRRACSGVRGHLRVAQHPSKSTVRAAAAAIKHRASTRRPGRSGRVTGLCWCRRQPLACGALGEGGRGRAWVWDDDDAQHGYVGLAEGVGGFERASRLGGAK